MSLMIMMKRNPNFLSLLWLHCSCSIWLFFIKVLMQSNTELLVQLVFSNVANAGDIDYVEGGFQFFCLAVFPVNFLLANLSLHPY